jgi:phosphoribosylaminoimidazole-succinocarboxamide synthase
MKLVKEGESKIVRYQGDGIVDIELKPTVYSFTHNRAGVIEGSDVIRYECCKILCKLLQKNGVRHSYTDYVDGRIKSQLVYEPRVFEPDDMSAYHISLVPKFCPIEVVVKRQHVGTPMHRYYDMGSYTTRFGTKITNQSTYPSPMVRFDWRNPNQSPSGERLCDEVMTEEFANFYIDVRKAKVTAILAFNVLSNFLEKRGLVLQDICFFIDEEGSCVFSEITPDCMRVTSTDEGSLDKDVWRAGGSSPLLLEKWSRFLELIK